MSNKPNHNRPYLAKDMDELVEILFMIKKSAEVGGLPDMHIENTCMLVAEIVDRQVLKALEEVKSKATNPPWASDSIQMVSLSAIEEIERLYK